MMSDNDARGVDFVQEYFNPHIDLLNQDEKLGVETPTCGDRWSRDNDDSPWECTRSTQHTGLHAALVEIAALDPEFGIRTVISVGAVWADDGELRR